MQSSEQQQQQQAVKFWPVEVVHVVSSGLRAKRVGTVHGLAYLWRVYAPVIGESRWRVERVRVLSSNDMREAGDRIVVGHERTRSNAINAIWTDALALAEKNVGKVGA